MNLSARRCFMIASVAAIAASCTSVPPLDSPIYTVPLDKIVERVKCELANAAGPKIRPPKGEKVNGGFLKSWTATVDLTFMVDANSGLSPGVSVVNPLVQVVDKARGTFSQSFSFGVGGALNGRAVRNDNIKFKVLLRDVVDRYFVGKDGEKCLRESTSDLDNNNLGLAEWIDRVVNVDQELDTIYHEVDFYVTMSLNATPTWNLVRFKGPGGGSSGASGGGASGGAAGPSSPVSGSFASLSRLDTHKLTLTMAPNTQKGRDDAQEQRLINQFRIFDFRSSSP